LKEEAKPQSPCIDYQSVKKHEPCSPTSKQLNNEESQTDANNSNAEDTNQSTECDNDHSEGKQTIRRKMAKYNGIYVKSTINGMKMNFVADSGADKTIIAE
jgi:predicted aspartyl protease